MTEATTPLRIRLQPTLCRTAIAELVSALIAWLLIRRTHPFALVPTGQLADQREQRQIHGYDDASNHDAEEDDHDRLDRGEHVLHCGVDLILVKVRDLLKHGIHRARLFANANHLSYHPRE